MLDQGELFDIPNPCLGICEVNNRGYCKGCLRSRTERFHWQEFTPFQKQRVVNACARRRVHILQAAKRKEIPRVDNAASTTHEQKDLFFAATVNATKTTVTGTVVSPANDAAVGVHTTKENQTDDSVTATNLASPDPHIDQQIDLF